MSVILDRQLVVQVQKVKANQRVKKMHLHLRLHLDALLTRFPSKLFSLFLSVLSRSILFFFYRPPISNEVPVNPIPESSIEEEPAAPTKAEAMPVETSELDLPLVNHNQSQISTRTNTRISAEYLTQHIIYRAQRLAGKVEPGMVNINVSSWSISHIQSCRLYEDVVQLHLKNSMKQVVIKMERLILPNWKLLILFIIIPLLIPWSKCL